MRLSTLVQKSVVIAVLLSTAVIFNSCQKELSGTIFSFGCKVSQWANLDSTSTATETFDYTYDTTTGKPLLLVYNDIVSGLSQTVLPVFNKDTVYFAPGSYAVLDNSKRIYRLEEQNSVNALAPDGSYFYTYDATGHIATRIYDDGTTTETTNYTFTGDELTKADEPLLGTPNAFTTTYSYVSTTRVKDYNAFILATHFPELRLYMPCFTFGKFTDKAIDKTVIKVNIPLIPIPEIVTAYTNYQFDAKGNFTKVQLTDSIGGTLVDKNFLSGSYLCR